MSKIYITQPPAINLYISLKALKKETTPSSDFNCHPNYFKYNVQKKCKETHVNCISREAKHSQAKKKPPTPPKKTFITKPNPLNVVA